MQTSDNSQIKKAVVCIKQKISAFEVLVPNNDPQESVKADNSNPLGVALEAVHEHLDRPDMLLGSTYKVKTPMSDHALYITINDVLLNQGTPFEQRHPYEIFINSKNMDHFMWVVALTRVISAVFRKGGDVVFMVQELKAVFDPKGGYFKKGGKYMPSLVAEIGEAIENHLENIGLLEATFLDSHQQQLIEEKRAVYDAQQNNEAQDKDNSFPNEAKLCNECMTKALILMDNCYTCLNCADSKCG